MVLWRSSETLINWIHTPMRSICSAEGTAGRSKPFTSTKQGLSLCRKGWMGPDVSSGREMLPKQGSFPGRNSVGSWKAFPSTSQRRSGQADAGKIFNLCAKQRIYKFSFLAWTKGTYDLSTMVFSPFGCLWMFPVQGCPMSFHLWITLLKKVQMA